MKLIENYTVIGFSRFTSTNKKTQLPQENLVAHVVCNFNIRESNSGSIGQKCVDLWLNPSLHGDLARPENVGKVAHIVKDLDNMVAEFSFPE